MAGTRRLAVSVVLYALCAIITPAFAQPRINYPFNSQVPPLARVCEPYKYRFASSTFAAPEENSLTYSLSGQPAWLELNGVSRTLTGTPGPADVGATSFTLSATDGGGVAHMSCTLVVSPDPPPQILEHFGQRLAGSTNLSSVQPMVVTLSPSSSFEFQFDHRSFVDPAQPKLYFYARLVDHTPLPSWVAFNSTSLTFSGLTPSLGALHQSRAISLIVSGVPGFSAVEKTFTVAVGTQQLAFVPEQQHVNVIAGMDLQFTALRDRLFTNGNELALGNLSSAHAKVPSWLSFDHDSLAISGTVPSGMKAENITVTVTDIKGDQAVALINLVANSNVSLFTGPIGPLTAHFGQLFNFTFPETLFAASDVTLQVTFPATVAWLQYDPKNRQLSGRVPMQTQPATIDATLVATAPSVPNLHTQAFAIELQPLATNAPTATKISPTEASTQSFASNPATAATAQRQTDSQKRAGIIATIVLSLLTGGGILISLVLMCRRRRRQQYLDQHHHSFKRAISRLTFPAKGYAAAPTSLPGRDVEAAGGEELLNPEMRTSEAPPQIGMDLPLSPRDARWVERQSFTNQLSPVDRSAYGYRAVPDHTVSHLDKAVVAAMPAQSHVADVGPGSRASRTATRTPRESRSVSATRTPRESRSKSATRTPRESRSVSATRTPRESRSVFSKTAKVPSEPSSTMLFVPQSPRHWRTKELSQNSVGVAISAGPSPPPPLPPPLQRQTHSWRSAMSRPRHKSNFSAVSAISAIADGSVSAIMDGSVSPMADGSTRGSSWWSNTTGDFLLPPTGAALAGIQSLPSAKDRMHTSVGSESRGANITGTRSTHESRPYFQRSGASKNHTAPLFALGPRLSSTVGTTHNTAASKAGTFGQARSHRPSSFGGLRSDGQASVARERVGGSGIAAEADDARQSSKSWGEGTMKAMQAVELDLL